MPFEWFVSRVCEEFSIPPTRALWEIENAPHGLIGRILEYRAYQHAKVTYDRAEGDVSKLDQSPMMDRVIESDFTLFQRRMQGLDLLTGEPLEPDEDD